MKREFEEPTPEHQEPVIPKNRVKTDNIKSTEVPHSSSSIQEMLKRIRESVDGGAEKEQSKLAQLQNILKNVKKSKQTFNLMKSD